MSDKHPLLDQTDAEIKSQMDKTKLILMYAEQAWPSDPAGFLLGVAALQCIVGGRTLEQVFDLVEESLLQTHLNGDAIVARTQKISGKDSSS